MNLGAISQLDLNRVFVGEQIASGTFRDVYECPLLPDCVVKIEDKAQSFHNIAEWEVWNLVKDTRWARWFAPCRTISSAGAVLIQARTQPAKAFPKNIPNFFADLKLENFGLLDGRFVCHDYGYNYLLDHGLAAGKLVRSKSRIRKT